MANFSNTSRPAYVWDGVNNQWVPVGVGPHTHSVADMTNAVTNLGGSNIANITATSVPLTLTGAVSQTADLFDVKNNAGTVVASIDANGNFAAQNTVYAGKNKIINGDFNIWQRGTSGFTGNSTYSADRWLQNFDGSGGATMSQQSFTVGSAPVSGYESTYFLRQTINTSGSATYFQLAQKVEDVRTFAGQTVTVSFWVKGDSARTGAFYIEQTFGSGGSGTVLATYQYFSITTSWQRVSLTFSMASIAGKTIGTGSYIYAAFRQGTTTANVYMDIWGVQIEAGSVATPFTTATGTFQGELALCNRYYQRYPYYAASNSSGSGLPTFASWSSNTAYATMMFPTPMRAAPTFTYSSASDFQYLSNNGANTTSFISMDGAGNTYAEMQIGTSAGFSMGYAGWVRMIGTSGWYAFSAEL